MTLLLIIELSGIGQRLADIRSINLPPHIVAIRHGVSPVLVEAKALPVPTKTIHLQWDYLANDPVNDSTNIVFELQKCSVPWQFGFYTNVSSTNFAGVADGAVGLFRVRSSNTVTHLVSEWGNR